MIDGSHEDVPLSLPEAKTRPWRGQLHSSSDSSAARRIIMYGQNHPTQPPSSPPWATNVGYLPAQVHPQSTIPKPPPTPFLHSVPLPNDNGLPYGSVVAPLPPRDIFPIDLTSAIDFHHLSRSVEDYVVPAQTPIYIRPTTGGPYFFQLNTGPSARRVFSVLHDLQTLVGAPLSLHDFRTGLSLKLSAQRAVRQYFVDRNRSGMHREAARVWRSFLKGRDLVNGPVGADLLRGHIFMWGFTQDNEGNWIIHVDLPRRL
ncbi:hypothetical protein FB45DRAFT_934659 [Roridomyces roridus]|uniref:Uncharacterized protein n=1 Tax=Roridomyces roridus TaxID=1738132 RepID=A0AAD7FF47_9AGAR|nr:hypothetical protein FB45DRAFT_934659 [Roridomyces roridus]